MFTNISYEGKNILLVEDQITTALVESKVIRKNGFELTHVTTGEGCIKMLQDGKVFDLILMDIDLGKGINGIETARRVLSQYDVPILFLSSHTELNVVKETESITSYGYTLKDGNVSVLLASIRMAMRLHHARSIYRRIYDESINGIVIHQLKRNESGAVVDCLFHSVNAAYESHAGLPAISVTGRGVYEVFGKVEQITTLVSEYEQMVNHATTIKKRIYFEPTQKWFDLNAFPIEGDYFTVVLINVTEQVKREKEIHEYVLELEKRQSQLSSTLFNIVEYKDPYTAGHQTRTAVIAGLIAGKMGLDRKTILNIRQAALIHDIGKISVPPEYLAKPGPLTFKEFEIIKEHPVIGYQLLRNASFDAVIAEVVNQHHEREDGSGYPLGISAEKILLESKIVGIADVIEAMASHRPYRPALGVPAAIEELVKYSGAKYSSTIVSVCVRLYHAGELGFLGGPGS